MRVRREELEEGKSDAALDLERQGAEGLELVEAASALALLVGKHPRTPLYEFQQPPQGEESTTRVQEPAQEPGNPDTDGQCPLFIEYYTLPNLK